MQVPTPLIWTIQQIVDSAFAMDPQLHEHLDSLDQKIIKIEETGSGLSIFILIVDRSIKVLGFYDGHIDTTIRGSAAAMLALNKDTGGLFTGDVALEGDLEVGKSMRQLIASLDIDWEEQLSKLTGDSIAHQVGRFHRSLFSAVSRTGTEFKENLSEYLTEETEMLANPHMITEFSDQIDRVRDDVERLDARVSLLEQRPGQD